MPNSASTKGQGLIRLLAAIACLAFVLGLKDAPRVELAAVLAPAAPASDSPRDAALAVTVTDASGGPVTEAALNVFWERAGVHYFVGSASTEADGSARIGGLPRGGAWVLVSAEGYARASKHLQLGAGASALRVTLVPEQELLVRVTDERGTPLRKATVLVTAADPLPFGALTDPNGRALVGRLPPAPWTVKVSAPGFESAERSGISSELVLALRRLSTLTVRVEDSDGAVAGGATVAIAGSTLWPARRTVTDQTGSTRISGLLEGAYDLQASRGGTISRPVVGFELGRGTDAELTLMLEPGRFVTAVVSDGAGEAALLVPNADVVLTPSGVGSFPLLGRTGSDGKAALGPIPPGPATLAARAEGFVSSALVAVPETTQGEVRVTLLRGATLRGDVVDTRDFPVEGAGIEVVGTDSFGLPVSETPLLAAFRNTHFDWALAGPAALIPSGELGVMPGPVPPIPAPGVRIQAGADLWALADAPPSLLDAWVSRPDGSFVATPVTPGRVRAVARHPDYVEGWSEFVTVGPGGEARVKIVLSTGGTLAGRVLDDRSQPVEGAEVELAGKRTSVMRTLFTAQDGSFEAPGIPSEVVVSVRRPGSDRRVALRKDVSVAEGKRSEIELILPALREEVTVTVTNGEDDPIELAEVAVLSLDPDVPLRETQFTDSAGRIEVTDARGLALRFVVEAPGFPRKAVVVANAPESVTVRLEAGVIVEGRVTAVRGRQGVEGARVTLLSEGTRRGTLTDADGQYRLNDVAAGRARLGVSHPEYAPVEREVEITATGRADRALELEPVDLAEPGSIEGEVVDARGDPVSGARVSVGLMPAVLPTGALPAGIVETDAGGRFVLNGVAEGLHTLEALSSVAGRGRANDVEVRAGRVTDRVRITLAPVEAADSGESGNVAITLGERRSSDGVELVVVQVAANSEAERAGVAPGDVLIGVDGTRPASLADARERMAGRAATDVVLELVRADERIVLRVARETVRR